ncbi:MAG TPA: HdeD family acid-resistance protein [Gemmataceae bacterium]|nr:HdeD family acid-resistance protein [Gemmataceae bacterium]
MNPRLRTNLDSLVREDLAMLRRNWVWFVVLGILLSVFGIAGLLLPWIFTAVALILVGWLMLVGGATEIVHAILRKGWKGFWLDLLSGLVTAAVGLLILLLPEPAAGALTLVIAMVFLFGGGMRMAMALAGRNPYGAWTLLHGLIGVLLGVLILAGWPESAAWVIGTLVAVDLLVNGIRLIAMGLAARELPREERTATEAG